NVEAIASVAYIADMKKRFVNLKATERSTGEQRRGYLGGQARPCAEDGQLHHNSCRAFRAKILLFHILTGLPAPHWRLRLLAHQAFRNYSMLSGPEAGCFFLGGSSR